MLTEQRLRARSRVGNLSKKAKQRPDDPAVLAELQQARRDYAAAALEAHIKALVDSAPPLTPEQRDRLAVLLAPGSAA